MEKLKTLLKEKRVYFLTTLVVLVFTLLIFLVGRYFPLGKNTIAHYDLYHQIVPQLNILFDLLEGKLTEFYLFSTGGGINALSFILYFIFSPFFLLVLPFGRANLLYSINLVLVLYLITISVVIVYFLRKLGKEKINTLSTVIIGTLYTFNSYLLFSYTYITWLNFMILMPLMVLAFLKLKDNGSILWLALVLAAMVYTCFGIGSFSLVIIYLLFTIYILLVEEDKKALLTRVTLAYVVGVLLSAFPLVVAGGFFQGGNRSADNANMFMQAGAFEYLDSKLFIFAVDIVMVFMALVFIIKCDKSDKLNRFLLAALGITLLPVFINYIAMFHNFGGYLGYANRQSFIYQTVILLMVIRLFTTGLVRQFFSKDKVVVKKQYKNIVIGVLVVALVFVVFLWALLYVTGKDFLYNASTYWLITLLGLAVAVIITSALLYLFFMHGKKLNLHKTFVVIIVSVAGMQVLSNNLLFFNGTKINVDKFNNLQQVVQRIDEDKRSERVMLYVTGVDASLPQGLGVNNFSGFNSMINKKAINSSKLFSVSTSINAISDKTGTLFTQTLYGYKYFISGRELNMPNFALIDSAGGYYLYENLLALPQAYYTNSLDFNVSADSNPWENQNNLFAQLSGGQDDLIEVLPIPSMATTTNLQQIIQDGEVYYQSADKKSAGYVEFSYKAEKDGLAYVSCTEVGQLSEVNFSSDGENWQSAVYKGESCLLQYMDTNQEITVRIKTKRKISLNNFNFAYLDYSAYYSWVSELQADSQNIAFNITKNSIKITAAGGEYKYIITPYVNIEGFEGKLNAQPADILDNQLNFLAIQLNEGQNEVEFTYYYKQKTPLIVVTVLGVVLAVAVLVIYKKTQMLNKMQGVIYVASLAVAGIIVLVFYIVPTLLFLYRLVFF